jgi:preprotein translocase subunit SecF
MAMFSKLYRGETDIQFIANRRKWYLASAVLILICVLSFIFRGFNYSIDFKGGTTYQIPATTSSVTTPNITKAFATAGVKIEGVPQFAGSGSSRQAIVNTESQTLGELTTSANVIAKSLNLPANSISPQTIGSDWGHETTVNALEGLIIFLIAVSIYVSIRYQWRMAVGAMVALLHDLVIAAGIYSLVGFELSPSTIVGLLTILGFSLYDTVVVFDKVGENSKDILAGSRTTFAEAANKAVNQTLMRSINTSLISLLPVAGLLFVGAGILGVGTIKDLALILFVGLASGAYSSLFLATPIVVELTERDPRYKQLARRVAARRASDAKKAADAELTGAVAGAVRRSGGPAPAPKVGARPDRRKRT